MGMRLRRRSLLWRLLATNALVIGAAMAFLSATPATIPAPDSLEASLLLVGAWTVILVVNLVMLRRALNPLRRLTELMGRIDPLHPGERIPPPSTTDTEVMELSDAFNAMLERLEAERRDATRRTVVAQEGERRRIAQELHDEIGQQLTAVLLQLEPARDAAPPEFEERLSRARETARQALNETRTIASRLRPPTLDDIGLVSALAALAKRISEQSGLEVDLALDPNAPQLNPEDEVVVYRVAQEALTNVLRHADATSVRLCFERRDGQVRLCVVDDGRGLEGSRPGGGLRGMRERAVLIGAQLSVQPGAAGGTEVALDIPIDRA